jgi:hypothetical protein
VTQQINLFNPIFLKQKKHFSAVTMVQALGVILLASILLGVYAGYELAGLRKEAEATTAQLRAAKAQLAQVSVTYRPRKLNEALDNEVKKTEAEIRSLQQVSETLNKGESGNTKGFAEYLRALSRQSVQGVWLTGFNVLGNELGIRGRALQPELVPVYLNRLKREQVMQGKSFATMEMSTPQEPAAKDASATAKPRNQPPYVEFSLQSSIADPAGVKRK